jgi:hypothetical protein
MHWVVQSHRLEKYFHALATSELDEHARVILAPLPLAHGKRLDSAVGRGSESPQEICARPPRYLVEFRGDHHEVHITVRRPLAPRPGTGQDAPCHGDAGVADGTG